MNTEMNTTETKAPKRTNYAPGELELRRIHAEEGNALSLEQAVTRLTDEAIEANDTNAVLQKIADAAARLSGLRLVIERLRERRKDAIRGHHDKAIEDAEKAFEKARDRSKKARAELVEAERLVRAHSAGRGYGKPDGTKENAEVQLVKARHAAMSAGVAASAARDAVTAAKQAKVSALRTA
jgi:hypothetical protein